MGHGGLCQKSTMPGLPGVQSLQAASALPPRSVAPGRQRPATAGRRADQVEVLRGMFSGLPRACRGWDLPRLPSLRSEGRAAPRVLCGFPSCPQQSRGNEGNMCPCSPAPFPAQLTPFPSPPLLRLPLSSLPSPQKGSFLRAESKSGTGHEHRFPGRREPSGDTQAQPPLLRPLQQGEPCPADSRPSSLLCCPGLLPRLSGEGSGWCSEEGEEGCPGISCSSSDAKPECQQENLSLIHI